MVQYNRSYQYSSREEDMDMRKAGIVVSGLKTEEARLAQDNEAETRRKCAVYRIEVDEGPSWN